MSEKPRTRTVGVESDRAPAASVLTHTAHPDLAARGAASATERVRLPAVDGFRGYAALAVLLYHVILACGSPPPLDEGLIRSVLVSGYMGVDFFFVISGFVLFLPAAANSGRLGNLRAYAIRRAARILPAYYLVLIGVVVLHPLITAIPVELPHTSTDGALSFFLHLIFLQHTVGIFLGFPEGFAIHGAVWTLALEALFYAVLPLVAGWYYRRPLLGLTIALAAATLWKLVVTHDSFSVPWLLGGNQDVVRVVLLTQLPTYLGHFAAGMAAAWLFVKLQGGGNRLIGRVAVPVQVLALAVMIMSMRSAGIRDLKRVGGAIIDSSGRWHYEHWTATTPVALAFAFLLLATMLAPRWARWPFTNWLALRLGDASYGIYLWHLVIIGFALQTLNFTPNGTDRQFLRVLVVTLVGSIVAGWLSFVFLERPFVRWARRKSRSLEQRTTLGSTSPGSGRMTVDSEVP